MKHRKLRLAAMARVTFFVATSIVLILSFQNCAGFNGAGGTVAPAALIDAAEQGKALYAQNCSVCHGPVDASAKRSRDASMITIAISTVPQMSALGHLTPDQIRAIARALASDPIAPAPVENENGRLEFACTPGQVAKTPMLKLTNREFRNSLTALLDDFSGSLKDDGVLSSLLANLPSDVVSQDRNTLKEQSLLNTQSITTAVFEASFHAGALVAGATDGLRVYPNTNQCLSASSLTQSCHQLFVRELASRAFRRRLTSAEGNSLAATLWDGNLSKSALLQLTFTSVVTMPDSLFKTYDRGTATATDATVLELTAHELAAKASFFLTGAPPDATLRGLADSGRIVEPQVLSQEVDRLLALPKARDTIQRLFREAYGYDVYDSFMFSPSYLNGVNATSLRESMTQELDHFFRSVVLDQRGTFLDLMTSSSTSLNSVDLAAIYGASVGATSLPAERAGFLNRAAMLTKRSGVTASPIKRGLKVLEHVLCEDVGLPPPSAPTALPVVEGQFVSTRERAHRTTEVAGTSCVSCHSKMNNLGYPFERFDSLGRARNVESIFDSSGALVAQVPIDTRATTAELSRTPTTVSDSAELGERLGNSDRAMMCFVKHLKRFESRVVAGAASNCQMNSSLGVLYGSGGRQGSIRDAIKSLILAPEFRRWSY